jgi:hypothetical protein
VGCLAPSAGAAGRAASTGPGDVDGLEVPVPVPLDRLSYLIEVEADHAPDADHREVPLPIGATNRHHTEFQDGSEFRNG